MPQKADNTSLGLLRKNSFVTVFFFVILLTALRVFSECLLLDYPFKVRWDQVLRFYLENIYYFMIAYFISSMILSKIIGEKLLPMMRFGLRFFPVILLPPWIDRFLAGHAEGYHYAAAKNFFQNIFTLAGPSGDASPGLLVEGSLVFIALLVFIYLKTKNVFKAAGGAVLIYLFVLILSTPDAIFPGETNFASDTFLPFYYFFPFLGLLTAATWIHTPQKCYAIIKNLRLLRASAFVILVLTGSLSVYYAGYRMHGVFVFYAACIGFFLWEVSVMVNDIYDQSIDAVTNRERPLITGALSPEDYRTAAALFSVLALSLAAILGGRALVFTGTGLLLTVIYSAPPLRLRKNLCGNAAIGLAMTFSFLIGIDSASYVPVVLDRKMLGFLGFIFLFGSVIPMAKDLKDLEGDRREGITNLFTKFGKENGKKIYCLIFFLAQTLPHSVLPGLLPLAALIGLVTSGVYYKTESLRFVYLVAITEGLVLFLKIFAF